MIFNCEICGTTFEPKRKARYCEKCRKDTNKARTKIDMAVHNSKFRLGEYDQPKEQTCKYCGKKFISLYEKDYCTLICSESFLNETKKCVVCNKLISNKKAINVNAANVKYCSDECKKKSKVTYVKICKGCNLDFEANKKYQKWCSVSCYNKNSVRPKTGVTVHEKACIVCEKRYKTRNKMQKCCSTECGRVSSMFKRNKEKKIKEEQDKLMAKRSENKVKDKPTNLCIDCKTSMKDCEWFSSNYTKHVKGSVSKKIDGKIILVECPKYKN